MQETSFIQVAKEYQVNGARVRETLFHVPARSGIYETPYCAVAITVCPPDKDFFTKVIFESSVTRRVEPRLKGRRRGGRSVSGRRMVKFASEDKEIHHDRGSGEKLIFCITSQETRLNRNKI